MRIFAAACAGVLWLTVFTATMLFFQWFSHNGPSWIYLHAENRYELGPSVVAAMLAITFSQIAAGIATVVKILDKPSTED